MELIHGTHKASKFASQDFITNLPDNVVTNILDRLLLRDAVRTSILSKSWRFKWTMLSQLLTESDAKKRFSTAFPSLKALRLSKICLDDGNMLSCAFDMIRSFPNLQTLVITACDQWYAGPPAPVEDYNTAGLLQLRSVVFHYMKGSENEVCFLRYLLACSPFLKQIVIHHHWYIKISSDEKLTFARKLLMLHRASPVAEIEFL
ncbi:F-box/FBD/LRR-repeat protein At1g13570-like isoform X3 [Helianthus annuus]|uniref:F-box/FBD/LRR-repeat protein At1g13570-like isoform X3 n=1 Tax=Helianthus annuus TaxID=4232 RepID=UPI000B8F15BD|nr:F-box/FBD/LRR-repeat protein At1g13570-like isoform X3 [Helianthus annuus]